MLLYHNIREVIRLKRLNLQVTVEMFEMLRKKAFEENRSVASIIREAIEKHLKV